MVYFLRRFGLLGEGGFKGAIGDGESGVVVDAPRHLRYTLHV